MKQATRRHFLSIIADLGTELDNIQAKYNSALYAVRECEKIIRAQYKAELASVRVAKMIAEYKERNQY